MLEPIVRAMMRGERTAPVSVKTYASRQYRGVDQATNWRRVESIIQEELGMTDLFLLLVDRDCVEMRRESLTNIEAKAKDILPTGKALLAENAWQEIEVWILAGSTWKKGQRTETMWSDIRAQCHPKEVYFHKFSVAMKRFEEPDGGRKSLAIEAAANYQRIKRRCPEVGLLESRIRTWIEATQP